MNARKFQKTLESILRDDSRYAAGAYVFVRMALDFTVKRLCSMNPSRKERHVSSKELLEGIRLFALETFGPMALPLFEEWGVRSCLDFADGYEFKEAFAAPFLPQKRKI